MDMNINTNMDWDINIYGKMLIFTVNCEIKKLGSHIIKQFSNYKRSKNTQRTPDKYSYLY
jgi:hypothetical protein